MYLRVNTLHFATKNDAAERCSICHWVGGVALVAQAAPPVISVRGGGVGKDRITWLCYPDRKETCNKTHRQ